MPLLQALLLLVTVAVIFVNGWTDAPNAIASAVSTGAMRYRSAVWMAAVCNLLGMLAMSFISISVADTIASMVRFDGYPAERVTAALCAAMLSIVLFAVAAWLFGIPTSESHALIAALTGAALAIGGIGGVSAGAWAKVLLGLVVSLAAGLLLGLVLTLLLRRPLHNRSPALLGKFQIAAAGGMACMHGAQDGQKFVAVLVIVDLLAKGRHISGAIDIREHRPALLFCAVIMALGTSVGGKRIIETVGCKMVGLQRVQGVCADLAGGICLFAASLCGIPMSTTHTKTTAIMGAGLASGRGNVDWGVIRRILTAWLITFPVCGLLGFGLTKLLVLLTG